VVRILFLILKHKYICVISDASSDSPDGCLAVLQSTKQELEEKSQLLVIFKEQLDSVSAEKQHVS
jgi:hypothetical protein